MWGVEDLEIAYGGRLAISGVSFSLMRGKVTALVGGDGAGKSSIIRAMVGAISPTAGRVTTAPAEQIGYMSAGPGLYRDLTVEENLEFAGRAYAVETVLLGQRMEELLKRTELEPARHRLAGTLSGGMRQKLALALAVLHQPSLLVLDEPTTGVDPVSRSELWRLISREAANGAAVLLATSYLDEAERAEEVVVLVDGSVLISGSPEAIVASIPGRLFEFPQRPEAWRRGGSWRVWSPGEVSLEGTRLPNPDLEDVVVIGELMRRRRMRESMEVPA